MPDSIVAWLHDALTGPGRLRFLIQPIVAILLGLRDGRMDALADRVPYLWGLVFEPGRKARLGQALRAALVPLLVAVVIDAVLQLITLGTIRPRWALAVGSLLVGLPYTAARALGNRATRALRRRRAEGGPQPHTP